jgi:hypothetical protein
MADGSQVEELNALRDNDHLFIFWTRKKMKYNQSITKIWFQPWSISRIVCYWASACKTA